MHQEDAAEKLFEYQQLFVRLEECFRQWGIAGLMRMIYRELNVKRNLMKSANGERALSNFTQLGDLLGTAERNNQLSPRGVLKFLQDKITHSATDDQSAEMLESDRSAVKLMTIHASKGLQFPIVFLPQLASRYPLKKSGLKVYHQHGELCCNPDGGITDSRKLAALEELQELMRLLYVAVTRAQHFCYMNWSSKDGAKNISTSALDWLFRMKNSPRSSNNSEVLKFLSFAGENSLKPVQLPNELTANLDRKSVV